MRKEEIHALEALIYAYGGDYEKGDDPPDAYFIKEGKRIAIEVSMLVEKIKKKSRITSRMDIDASVASMSKFVDDEVGDLIPDDKCIYLGLKSPILEIPKFKAELLILIKQVIDTNENLKNIDIFGNRVSIHYKLRGPSAERVVQFHSTSQKFSIQQASELLRDRILDKTRKMRDIINKTPCWLILINTYWSANIDTYREIYARMNINHPFEEIFIVDQYLEIERLF